MLDRFTHRAYKYFSIGLIPSECPHTFASYWDNRISRSLLLIQGTRKYNFLWVNYQFSTYFFLKTHSEYVLHNTPGGFGNASAPAVAATPIMR